jgi:hypothetical protein
MKNFLLAATFLLLGMALSEAIRFAQAQDAEFERYCPIYAVRTDPKDPTRNQKWLTPAERVIFETPHGDVYIEWDGVNDNLYIQGRELQKLDQIGNVMRVSVIEDLP